MSDELGETLDIGPAIRQMAKEELAKLDAPKRTPLSGRMEDVWAESVADGDEHLCIAHDLWLELKGEVAALEQERDQAKEDAYNVRAMLESGGGEYRRALAEVERLRGKWEEAGDRCPQCGTGNPNVERLRAAIREIRDTLGVEFPDQMGERLTAACDRALTKPEGE